QTRYTLYCHLPIDNLRMRGEFVWVFFKFSVTANAVGEGVIGMVSGGFVSSGFEVGAVEFLSFEVE
ncbi:hypothetical protein, partial [Salmonella enterica]|uniref:hypothetical protein n=1 Tax=Salmonella enterica TaxID=28901 RepID=UPI00396718FC